MGEPSDEDQEPSEGLRDQTAEVEPQGAPLDSVSFYEQIGGESGTRLFVDHFYRFLQDDPAIARFFASRDVSALKKQQIEFMAIILGGRPPLDYWDIITSEPPSDLSIENTDAMIEYAFATLHDMGISEHLAESIVRLVSPFVDAFIVGCNPARSGPPIIEQTADPASEEMDEDQEEFAYESLDDWSEPAEALGFDEGYDPGSVDAEYLMELGETPSVPAERVDVSDTASTSFSQTAEEAENAERFRALIQANLAKMRQVSSSREPAVEAGVADKAEELISKDTRAGMEPELNTLSGIVEQLEKGDLAVSFCDFQAPPVQKIARAIQSFVLDLRSSIEKLAILIDGMQTHNDDLKRILLDAGEMDTEGAQKDEELLRHLLRQTSEAAALAEAAMQSVRNFGQPDKARAEVGLAGVREPINALLSHNQEIFHLSNFLHEMGRRAAALALNSALEAARAGQQGKCFGVIANELKEMALETERVSKHMSTNFKACRYYAHEALQNLGSVAGPGSTQEELRDEFRTRGEALQTVLCRLETGLKEALNENMSRPQGFLASPVEATKFTERLYRLGKKLGELREIVSRYSA